MGTDNQTKERIIDFWRAIELFSPQPVPRVDPSSKQDPVFDITPQSLPPWHNEHSLQRRPIADTMTWRHQVYIGIFNLGRVLEILEEKIGRDPDSPGEFPNQPTAIATFSVSNAGRLLPNTLVVSTCAWVSARTLYPGPADPSWLSGFDEIAGRITQHFLSTLPTLVVEDAEEGFSQPKSSETLSTADLFYEAQEIIVQLGALPFIDHLEIRIKSFQVSRRKENIVEESDSLNSFYIHDLERVANKVRAGDFGAGLAGLLTDRQAIDRQQRIDVRAQSELISDLLAPDRFPQGRWPSGKHKPLYLSQQLALNWTMLRFGSRAGLTSVNGPPGTGKTTLIRDIVAAVVVERAKVLATLTHPGQAFTGKTESWTDNGFLRTVSFWHEGLHGFEIVVASSNNGAVENVVLEIPVADAVDPSYRDEDIYFADFARRLLDEPAWALVATRLGNKSNRNSFVNQFWYGGISHTTAESRDNGGFQEYLKDRQNRTFDWTAAVKQFKQVLEQEEQQRDTRSKVRQVTLEIEPLRSQCAALAAKLTELATDADMVAREMASAESDVSKAAKAVEESIESRRLHHSFKPGLWEIVFTFGKALRRWQEKDKPFEAQIEQSRNNHKECQVKLDEWRCRGQELAAEQDQYRVKLNSLETQLQVKLDLLTKAVASLGQHVVRPDDLEDIQTREILHPWSDPQWNATRTEVFRQALRLHQEFIHCNARTLRQNLFVAMDILSSKVPHRLSDAAAQAAWTSLFFVIPVISTTFASFDRLFRHLQREALGWLLIDEGGQATPQSAVGAIWRAKRTVVLGDPLQLEPIVTLPLSIQQALRRHFQVDEAWLPGKTSLQQLADDVNPLGTTIDLNNGNMWVGTPLRVHRRCDRLMFDISNRIAYGGQMVFDTPARAEIGIRPSMWLDVVTNTAEQADEHWLPAEGERLKELLAELAANGTDIKGGILLLSPFRSVARQLSRLAKPYQDIQVGTIHVAQGKEADIVIVVLGGHPERQGAKRWASARPNLLNVAASRAKRRLYVIGNKKEWSRWPFFGDAAALLTSNEQRNLIQGDLDRNRW